MSALSFHAFGTSEFAYRLPVTATGSSSLIAVFLLIEPWGGPIGGIAGALALYDVIEFLQYARRGQFDVLYITWLLWALCLYQLALLTPRDRLRRRRWLLVGAGVALGLCSMSKIAIGVVLFAALTAPVLVGRLIRQPSAWRDIGREIGVVGGVAIAIWLPWHIAMTALHGATFWEWNVGFHLLNRSTQVLDQHSQPAWFYLLEMYHHIPAPTLGLLFALPFLALGSALPRRFGASNIDDPRNDTSQCGDGGTEASRASRDPRRAWPVVLWMVLLPLALLSAATTKRDTYFLILPPMIAVAAGVLAGALWQGRVRRWWTVGVGIWLVGWLLWERSHSERVNLGIVLDGLGGEYGWGDLGRMIAHSVPKVAAGAIVLTLAGSLFLALIARCWRSRDIRWERWLARIMVMLFLWFTFVDGIDEVFDTDRGRRHYGWQQLRPIVHAGKHDSLIFVGGYDGPALGFYLMGGDWADRDLSTVLRPADAAKTVAIVRDGHRQRLLVIDRWSTPEQDAAAVRQAALLAHWWRVGESQAIEVWATDDLEYRMGEVLPLLPADEALLPPDSPQIAAHYGGHVRG